MPWFTKQRKKKAKNIKHKRSKKIFRIKLRNDRFRLFGPHSKPISDSRPISACFGRFGRRPKQLDPANMAWFWPNQPGSTQIEAKLAQIEPSQREYVKKKSSDAAPMCKQPRQMPHPASDSGEAPSQPRPCFIVCHTRSLKSSNS